MVRLNSERTQPTVKVISKSLIPGGGYRGRKALVTSLPFWNQMVDRLKSGLGPQEAIEIELAPVKDEAGKTIPPQKLVTRIQYQFHKQNFSKKHSLLVRGKDSQITLYVVDHQTAHRMAA
jgi:hypothetical protein